LLRQLAASSLSVGELAGLFDVEQGLMSHHLGVLRTAALVVRSREGRQVRYRLVDGVLGSDASVIRLGCCDISFRPG